MWGGFAPELKKAIKILKGKERCKITYYVKQNKGLGIPEIVKISLSRLAFICDVHFQMSSHLTLKTFHY